MSRVVWGLLLVWGFLLGWGCGVVWGWLVFSPPTETIQDSNGAPEEFIGQPMFQQRVDIDARGCDAFLIDPSQTELNIDLRGCIIFSYRPAVNFKD